VGLPIANRMKKITSKNTAAKIDVISKDDTDVTYNALFQGATLSGSWKLNWKSWVLPRVRFFIWLACLDRCWTSERLARRGLPHAPRCLLCDQSEETMARILTGCSFSRKVWFEVLSWFAFSQKKTTFTVRVGFQSSSDRKCCLH
jgi:hypothetical protein